MTMYTNVKVNISEGQKEKLQHPIKAGCPAVSIRLGHEDQDDDILAVTYSQVRKLAKALETITMSSKQLKHNTKIAGGFSLSFGRVSRESSTDDSENRFTCVSALSGLASSGVHKAMGSGFYLKKGGCVSQVETDGSGLYLKPYKGQGLQSYGDGLYVRQGGKLYDGKGLLLGPNSPFANIPILGAIL